MGIEYDFNKFMDQFVGMMFTRVIMQSDKIPEKDKDYIFELIKIFIKHGIDFNTALNILNDISDLNRN